MNKSVFYRKMFKCCADKTDWRISLTGINFVINDKESILTASGSHFLVQVYMPLDFVPSSFNGKIKDINGVDVEATYPDVKAILISNKPNYSYKYSIKELINICNFMLKHENGVRSENKPTNRIDFNGAYINVKFLKNVLNVLSMFSLYVTVEVTDDESPVVFRIKDSKTFGIVMPALKYDFDKVYDSPYAKVEYTIDDAIELMDAKPFIKDKMWYE